MNKLIIALVAVALLLPVTPVLADDEPPGITIFGEDYTVESGTTIKGNLTVFGGDVVVEDGGAVAGTIVVWGGNAEIAGTVEGDLVVSGGDIQLGDDAWVQGDIVCSWDCSVEQAWYSARCSALSAASSRHWWLPRWRCWWPCCCLNRQPRSGRR
jgi:hypothetical protein